MARTCTLFLFLLCIGCAESGTTDPASSPLENEEAQLQAEIDALGSSLDSMRGQIDRGFQDVDSLKQKIVRSQEAGDSLQERIEANQREIDEMMGQ